MKVREMRQLIHDKPDDYELEFAAEGTVYSIGANVLVPEWSTLYFGSDDEDLTCTLMEYDAEDQEEDREAFLEALARDEDAQTVETWEGLDEDLKPVGECCTLPPLKEDMWDRKQDTASVASTEMM